MKLQLALAAALFVACLAVFLTRGLDAYADGRRAAASLATRVEALEQARREVSVVAHASVDRLSAERAAVSEIVGQRRALLAGGPLPEERRDLAQVLEGVDLPSLARGQPLRNQLLSLVPGRPRLEAALAAILVALDVTRIEQLEALTVADADPHPVPGIPGLVAHEFELVVVSEVPEVLALLESMVPGRVAPILTVSGASVRRIEPALWPSLPDGLLSPPVRLWLKLAATHAAEPGGTGG